MRLFLQGYVEIMISAMFSMELTSQIDLIFTNLSDSFAYICGFIFFVVLSILPVVIGNVLVKKIDMLEAQVETR
jgi:hypothetical protein